MTLLAISRHPSGYRVHILGARIHHGLVGAFLVFWGAFLIGRDIDDFPWLSD